MWPPLTGSTAFFPTMRRVGVCGAAGTMGTTTLPPPLTQATPTTPTVGEKKRNDPPVASPESLCKQDEAQG